MRVGVYVPDIRPESGGALTFVRDVLGALAAVTCTHEFHVLYSGPTPPEGSGGLSSMRVPEPSSATHSTLDATANRLGLEIVWFLVPQSQPVTLPFIATVWDLEHRNQPYFPEVSVSGWTWQERELYYRSTLPRATCVIVGTEEGKRQIERYYSVRSSLIAVVPFVTPSFLPEELREDSELFSTLGIRSPFFFYPAQFWPHKNHATLLHAVKKLSEQGQFVDLVLTGSDQGTLGHVREMASKLGLDSQVRFLGFVDRRTIVMLYRKALALVFPSFFGPDNLPPLEAFALGCPVVAAAVPGATELFGDAAILLDPADEAAWADTLRLLFQNPQCRTELAERGLARSRHSTPADYVRAVAARLDAFEPVRRCWPRNQRYMQPGVQATAAELAMDLSADRASRLGVIRTLQAQLDTSEADRAARLKAIHTLETQLSASEADRAARLDAMHTLETQLKASEADRAARLDAMNTLETQLKASEADRAARLDTIHTLEAHLKESEADRAARLDVIHALETQLAANKADLDEALTQLVEARSRLDAVERSRSWRWTSPARWFSGARNKRRREA